MVSALLLCAKVMSSKRKTFWKDFDQNNKNRGSLNKPIYCYWPVKWHNSTAAAAKRRRHQLLPKTAVVGSLRQREKRPLVAELHSTPLQLVSYISPLQNLFSSIMQCELLLLLLQRKQTEKSPRRLEKKPLTWEERRRRSGKKENPQVQLTLNSLDIQTALASGVCVWLKMEKMKICIMHGREKRMPEGEEGETNRLCCCCCCSGDSLKSIWHSGNHNKIFMCPLQAANNCWTTLLNRAKESEQMRFSKQTKKKKKKEKFKSTTACGWVGTLCFFWVGARCVWHWPWGPKTETAK